MASKKKFGNYNILPWSNKDKAKQGDIAGETNYISTALRKTDIAHSLGTASPAARLFRTELEFRSMLPPDQSVDYQQLLRPMLNEGDIDRTNFKLLKCKYNQNSAVIAGNTNSNMHALSG